MKIKYFTIGKSLFGNKTYLIIYFDGVKHKYASFKHDCKTDIFLNHSQAKQLNIREFNQQFDYLISGQ